MFCPKCGNPLKDGDRFCAKCGAPVVKQEVPQEKPTGEPVYSQTPMIGSVEAQPVHRQTAALVQKKSKKGLIIGLSLGGVMLAVILAVALIFVFCIKGGSKGNDGSVPLGYSTVYDDQYTYFLNETKEFEPCIKRIRNDLSGDPEILYEAEEIKGDGWSQYPMGCIFLWNEKICFIEITKATEQGNDEYEIHWLSKNGKENGTLVSYEHLNTYGDLLSQMEGAYFFNDYLIFGNRFSFYRLDLNTGELCRQEDFLDLEGPACFVAYNDGYYYYFVPDVKNNLMGETLYRKAVDSEEEKIGRVPSQDDDDWEKYFSFIPKGDYLYYADSDNICRLNINDGRIETLASYEGTYNRFTMCENGLYYFKDMTLRFLNTETLEETVFDEVERIPALIYAGANDSCWMQGDATSHRYDCFLPDKQGGSLIYFGESGQDASTDDRETVNTTELYASIVEIALERYGSLSFGGSENECYAQGVVKIDLKDFNQDGIDELMMLYTEEGNGIFPYIDVFTVEDGGVVKLFSKRSREEFHEAAMSISLYQNAGNLYVPVYDSLDNNPVYVHLYGFDKNGEFGEVYQYENNAFYMNQLPDGMEFTECERTQFYTNTQFAYYDGFENVKEEMIESLQTDMEYMLNELGLAIANNGETSSNKTISSAVMLSAFTGEWICNSETTDMSAYLYLNDGEDGSLICSLSFYRLSGDTGYITLDSGNKGRLLSASGKFNAEVEFDPESDSILVRFPESTCVYDDTTVAFYFGTQELRFVRPK